MTNKLHETVEVLDTPKEIALLEDELEKRIRRAGILKNDKKLEFKIKGEHTDFFFVGVKINKEDNILDENIEIAIKPDNSEHRVLRLLVFIGKYNKEFPEDEDRAKWSTEKVIDMEIRDVSLELAEIFSYLKSKKYYQEKNKII